jgi:hypothetical protein
MINATVIGFFIYMRYSPLKEDIEGRKHKEKRREKMRNF